MGYIYNDNGIQFTDVKLNGSIMPGAILSTEDNYETSGTTITNKYDDVINAIDIDWNGAQLKLNGDSSNRTINTTGELLSQIKGTYSLTFAN